MLADHGFYVARFRQNITRITRREIPARRTSEDCTDRDLALRLCRFGPPLLKWDKVEKRALPCHKLPASLLAPKVILIVPGPNHTLPVAGDAHLNGAGPTRFVSRYCNQVIMDTG